MPTDASSTVPPSSSVPRSVSDVLLPTVSVLPADRAPLASTLPRSAVWITPPPAVVSVPPVSAAVCRFTCAPAPLARIVPACAGASVPPAVLSTAVFWITNPPGPVSSSSPVLATVVPPVFRTMALMPVAFTVPALDSVKLPSPSPSLPAPWISPAFASVAAAPLLMIRFSKLSLSCTVPPCSVTAPAAASAV